MTLTSSPTPGIPERLPAGALAHGLISLGHHIVDNDLPAPTDISLGSDRRHVRVLVDTDDLGPWLRSLLVFDAIANQRGEWVHTTYVTNTPTGLVVYLKVIRRLGAMIEAVAGATA